MAALEASVKAAKDARKRHPAGGPHEEAAPKASGTKASSKAAAADAESDASEDDTAAIAKPKRVRKSA
jgi:hypothetical protein